MNDGIDNRFAEYKALGITYLHLFTKNHLHEKQCRLPQRLADSMMITVVDCRSPSKFVFFIDMVIILQDLRSRSTKVRSVFNLMTEASDIR